MSTAADIAEAVVKRLIYEVVVKAVIAKAVAALPFLGYPVIGPIFAFFVTKFADLVYEELARVVTFAVIDFQVERERAAFEEAAGKLKDTLATPPEHYDGGPEEKEKKINEQKEEFKRRLADLIRLRP